METLEKKTEQEPKQNSIVDTTQTSTNSSATTYNFTKRQYPFTQTINTGYYNIDFDPITNTKITHTSSLPSGVKGMIYTTSGSTFLKTDNPSRVEIFVRYHEEAHRYGILDESKADAYASARAGYNLRPFGESNLLE